MASPHLNETATRSQPREAAMGELTDDATIESVTAALASIGIEPNSVSHYFGKWTYS